MHPLDTIIDDSHHCPRPTVARRRSSLDNSCLAAPDAFRQIMMDSCGSDDDHDHHLRGGGDCRKGGRRSGHRERRLSWNSDVSKPTTFLAGPMTPSSRPKKVELDADFHHSHHSPKGNNNSYRGRGGSSGHAAAQLTNSPPVVSDAGDDDSDSTIEQTADDRSEEGSLDSDCDSFCDASFQEPANREYLRRDLGASCYWASTDNCMLGDLDDEDFDEVECVVDTMLRNEGLDGLRLDD